MSESPALFEARSAPLQSLGTTGFRIVAGVLLAGFAFTGTVMSVLGAWPVLPFAGVEAALAIGLMALYRRRAGRSAELVVLVEGQLRVTRREGRRREEASFDPFWARLSWEGERRLFLGHRARRIEIGRFLAPEEKQELGRALEAALRHYRAPVFDNPQLRDS
jgi:uncharacterized membrane protein